jgi:4TM region of DNA translocase FtsK/SpoIIIE
LAVAISRPAHVASQQRWPLARDGLAVVGVGLGLFVTVVLIVPAEGRIGVPMREGLSHLLGSSAFLLPVALILGGVVTLVHSLAPDVQLPFSRLFGLALLAVASLPTRHLLAADSAGVIGATLGSVALDLVGGPATVFVMLLMLLIGALLTFDIRRWRRHAEN